MTLITSNQDCFDRVTINRGHNFFLKVGVFLSFVQELKHFENK